MRASVFRAGSLTTDTIADPVPGKDEVLVRTLACGICGTDLHFMSDGPRMAEQMRRAGMPLELDFESDVVFGHEFSAEIVDHGPGTPRRLKAGTRVTAMPLAVGLSNRYPGGYGELMVLPEAALLEVPNGLGADHAALTEPLAVGLHAVNRARLTSADAPLVIGCGPVGLAVIAALKLAGAAPIVAADFSPARRRLAQRLGADVVVDPAVQSPYRSWTDAVARDGGAAIADAVQSAAPARCAVVFECVGATGITQQIIENVPPNARVVMVGACPAATTFEPMLATLKEVSLLFSAGYTPDEFALTLRHLADGKVDAEAIITSHVDLDGVSAAMKRLANPDQEAKIIIEP